MFFLSFPNVSICKITEVLSSMFPRQYCTSVKTVDTMEKLVYILKLAQADISHEEVILNEHKYYHRCKTFKI